MRDSLKFATFAICLLSACTAAPSKKPADDVVPQELVPAGYQQSDCHFDKLLSDEEDTQDSGFQGMSGQLMDKVNRGGGTHVVHPSVTCEHTTKDNANRS